jgi:uncharacterized RDD family membrane protein YckC
MIDTVVTAETPEGMLLELQPAGLAARFQAFMIDWGIRLTAAFVTAILTSVLGGVGTAFWLIGLFALEWLYPIAFELTPAGATPGKRVIGLKVVMESGLPVTPAASIARNILRVADFLPFAYAGAIVSILVRGDCRRLGDIAAGTLVVYSSRVTSPSPLSDVAPVPPARTLTLADQAALVALAARAPRLTSERLDELAALAAVVSGDAGRSGTRVTDAFSALHSGCYGADDRTAVRRELPRRVDRTGEVARDAAAWSGRLETLSHPRPRRSRFVGAARRAVPPRMWPPCAGPGPCLSATSGRSSRNPHGRRAPTYLSPP